MTMIAGDDISMADDLISSARETLASIGPDPAIAQVQSAMFAAWRDTQNKVAEATVLNPYRLTVPEFIRTGLVKFGESKFLGQWEGRSTSIRYR
jgi:hypothetical protein